MTEDDKVDELQYLLYQGLDREVNRLATNDIKVAHYTTADNAAKIFAGKALWLRNAAVMNDFLEMSFGWSCLRRAIQSNGDRFRAALDLAHPELVSELLKYLNEDLLTVRTQTYLTSAAEHSCNDLLGRLSMWRAYGGPVAGVAILFNIDAFANQDTELNVFAHPVVYGEDAFQRNFGECITQLENSQTLLAEVPRGRAQALLFHRLRDYVLTAKHEGFEEEQEWRLIHSPYTLASEFVKCSVESIAGIPQIVYRLSLEDVAGAKAPELALDKLIHRVIVGPCRYPEQVADALHKVMVDSGISEPAKRISVSHIPLRQHG